MAARQMPAPLTRSGPPPDTESDRAEPLTWRGRPGRRTHWADSDLPAPADSVRVRLGDAGRGGGCHGSQASDCDFPAISESTEITLKFKFESRDCYSIVPVITAISRLRLRVTESLAVPPQRRNQLELECLDSGPPGPGPQPPGPGPRSGSVADCQSLARCILDIIMIFRSRSPHCAVNAILIDSSIARQTWAARATWHGPGLPPDSVTVTGRTRPGGLAGAGGLSPGPGESDSVTPPGAAAVAAVTVLRLH
jgi:hypothetical protein